MNEVDSNNITEKWNEIRDIVEALELDVAKNIRGVAAAGVRLRKGLRRMRQISSELVKFTVITDKAAKAEREKKAENPTS